MQESDELQSRSLEILIETYGRDHVRTAEQMLSLAVVKASLKERIKARDYYRQAALVHGAAYGSSDGRTLTSLRGLIRTSDGDEEFADAEGVASSLISDYQPQRDTQGNGLLRLHRARRTLYGENRWNRPERLAEVEGEIERLESIRSSN